MINAGDPSNIIWENKHIQSWTKVGRYILCTIVVFLITAAAFYAITMLKIQSNLLTKRYANIDCPKISELYSAEEI
jgi:hypothetical protein